MGGLRPPRVCGVVYVQSASAVQAAETTWDAFVIVHGGTS